MQTKTWSRAKRLSIHVWLASLTASTASATSPAALPVRIGQPVVVENLTVFPVQGGDGEQPIPLTTLDAALANGDAEVSELDESGDVGRLYVQNKGKLPIYVLAGTVVKGGKQDRQFGQDVVIEQGRKISVDAFCVERGRWTPERAGEATGGRFTALAGLGYLSVRRAAQYERNQGEVWREVDEVNHAHRKSAPSRTLTGTLDDADVAARRGALIQRIEAALRATGDRAPVIGIGYAVDGQVRNVRWFQSASAFALFRTRLLESAALEALTAQARHGRRSAPRVETAAVEGFIRDIEAGASETRETEAQNRNEYRESKAGYSAKARLKTRPANAAPVSTDYTSK